MDWFNGVSEFSNILPCSVITIGNFDGVHLGHRFILDLQKKYSLIYHCPRVVITFEPHPISALYPERPFKRIFDAKDKRETLQQLGTDILITEPFSRQFSEIKPEVFLTEYITNPFHPKVIIVGQDFTFGMNRQGNSDFLKNFFDGKNVKIEIVEPFKLSGEIVSSSSIRHAVLEGKLKKAEKFLGRPFYLTGIVERGEGRGRQLGFPTANILTPTTILPKAGVYASRTTIEGSCKNKPTSESHFSMTNIGSNPTFNSQNSMMRIETHILNFNQDIYGRSLHIELLEFIREEKRFSDSQELVKQIQIDIETAKHSFTTGE